MKTEAYKEAQKRYDAKKTKFYGVKLNIETDADLIKALDTSDNRQGLIKKAIRSYLETLPVSIIVHCQHF